MHAPNARRQALCGAKGRKVVVTEHGAPHDCAACIERLAGFEREASEFSLRHFEVRDKKRCDEAEADFTAPEPVVALLRFWLRRAAPDLLSRDDVKILDPSAGAGIFGQVLQHLLPRAHLTGIELRGEEERHITKNYTEALIADFEEWAAQRIAERKAYEKQCEDAGVAADPRAFRFDAILTNPPFSRAFRRDIDKPTKEILRRAWIEVCHDLLVPGGTLVFIGLTQWGQTQENSELVKAYPPWLQYRFGGRLSFEDHGQTDSREYSGWIWRNLYGKLLELRVEDQADPEWTTANGRQLAVRKWQAGSIPGTYPLPLELFA